MTEDKSKSQDIHFLTDNLTAVTYQKQVESYPFLFGLKNL